MSSALVFIGGVNRPIGYVAKAAGEGIAAFLVDLETGTARSLGVTGGIDNPTFVAVSPDGQSLLAVSEVAGWNEGTISAYVIDPNTGALTYLNKQPTRGDATCHLGFDHSGRYAASVNYAGLSMDAKPNRSVVVYPRHEDGSLGAPAAEMTHKGTGGDPKRQDRPHAHCVRWTRDNRFVIVADLGIDRLVIYRFDEKTGALTPHGEAKLPAGAGPRHFCFHPDLPVVYCANELDCTLATLAFDAEAGTLEVTDTLSTLPAGEGEGAAVSAIAIAKGGRHVFVGNRFHDSIARFEIDPKTGAARFLGTTPCGGRVPRDFAFDPSGEVLVVANQESDRLNLFRYRTETGGLDPFGDPIKTGSPTAVAFHPKLR